MKNLFITAIAIVSATLFVVAQSSDIAKFRAEISDNKDAAKKELGSYKYDGAKVTYFNYKKYDQVKEVEVYLFNNTNYKLSFNGNSIPGDAKVEIYNNSKIEEDRVLLAEIENLSGKEVQLNSDDLNKSFKKKFPNAARLKRVYVNYVIPSSKSDKKTSDDRGAAILVLGYK